MRAGVPFTIAAIALTAGCSFDASGLAGGAADPDASQPPPPVDATRPGAPDAGDDDGDDDGRPDAGAAPDAEPPELDAGDDDDDDARGDLHAPYAQTPPVLDGDLGEWNARPAAVFDIADRAHEHDVHEDYESSATATTRAVHDDGHLYIAVEVQSDPNIVTDSFQLFEDDAMNVYLDGDNDRGGMYGQDDHAIVVRADGAWEDTAHSGTSGVEVGSEIDGDGYAIEVKIPKSLLGNGPSPDLVGFNFAITDDDGLGSSESDAYGLWILAEGPRCASCCQGVTDEPQAWCDTTMLGELSLGAPGD